MRKQTEFDLAKALSFLLAFVAFSMIIGVGFLVPTVRNLNKQSIVLAVETKSFKAVKEKYNEEETRLANLKKENESSIKALSTSFNQLTFQKESEKNFGTILQQTDSGSENGYSVIEYNVAMNFHKPSDLFSFLDTLDGMGSLVKIQTPVTISTTSDGLATNYYLRAITLNALSKKEVNSTSKH